MKVNDVISTLKSRGVELWQESGTLRYRARLDTLTDKEKATLRAHKASILKVLGKTHPPPPVSVAGSTAVTDPPARECRNCAHFEPYPYEPLGSCHARRKMQHATSKPQQFGCGHFQPTTGQQEVRP